MKSAYITAFCEVMFDLFDAIIAEFSVRHLGTEFFRQLSSLLSKNDCTEACNLLSSSFNVFIDEDVVVAEQAKLLKAVNNLT